MATAKRSILTIALFAIAALTIAQTSEAQLFRRQAQRTKTVTQLGCETGTCMTGNCVTATRAVTRVRQPLIFRPTTTLMVPATVIYSAPATTTAAPALFNLQGSSTSQPTTAPEAPAFLPPPPPSPTPAPPQAFAYDVTFGLSEVSIAEPPTIPTFVLAQIDEAPATTAMDAFKQTLVKAIAEQRKANKISMRDAIKLRVAMLSPAFVERAHQLAVTQVAFSGETSEAVPLDADGMVQVEGINWDGLIKFLEALVPLLLTLLKSFGA